MAGMTLPSWRDWLFSAKTFAAAMLALYIALALDLPRPYWAMATVYVVANPLAGATNSKALYRTLGTLLGATGAVFLVPLLVNAPELLMGVVALWAGLFFYASMLDRSPRSYVFMLAAYTLPLVALPGLSAPETIFDVAVARSQEIILGIVCASVVGSVIFPASLGPVFGARVSAWLNDAGAWAEAILRGRERDPIVPLARQRLAADVAALDMLIAQLSHDANTRETVRWARALRARLLQLLPVLSSLGDRLHALRLEPGADAPGLEPLLDDIAAWIAGEGQGDEGAPQRFRLALQARNPDEEAVARWDGIVRSSLIARLLDLVNLWEDCLALRRLVTQGGDGARWAPSYRGLRTQPVRYYDHGMMAFSAASAALATLAAGLICIASGWPGGAFFIAMVTISCCFFGAMDRPAPAMRMMLIWTGVSFLLAAFYLFGVLPLLHDFEMVVLTLAVPYLLLGALLPRPQMALITLLMAVNTLSNLSLQSRYGAEFGAYLNEAMAALGGLGFAWLWTLIVKPFGADVAARRLLKAGWADLADFAGGLRAHEHAVLTGRSLDRLGQLVPRLAASDAGEAIDGLKEIRIGYNVLALQRDRRALRGAARASVGCVLAGLAAHFRRLAEAGEAEAAPPALLEAIDAAFAAIVQEGDGSAPRDALHALAGLRRALFPHAPGPQLPDPPPAQDPAPLLLAAE